MEARCDALITATGYTKASTVVPVHHASNLFRAFMTVSARSSVAIHLSCCHQHKCVEARCSTSYTLFAQVLDDYDSMSLI